MANQYNSGHNLETELLTQKLMESYSKKLKDKSEYDRTKV